MKEKFRIQAKKVLVERCGTHLAEAREMALSEISAKGIDYVLVLNNFKVFQSVATQQFRHKLEKNCS